jgi:nickel/cobalt exporter
MGGNTAGDIAAWSLCGVGVLYLVWGLRHAYQQRPQERSGWHSHGDVSHYHTHLHANKTPEHTIEEPPSGSLTPWAIFIIFVLGPCEPLIPLLMFPAATQSVAGIFWVTGVFAIVTVVTMLGAVAIGQLGLERLRVPALARFGHSSAGATMLGCGIAIGWMGL